MFVVHLVLVCSFFVLTTILALSLNPAQALPAQIPHASQLQLPNISLPNYPISPAAAGPSSPSTLAIQCDPQKYGHDVRYAGCQDAYEQIPRTVNSISFGPRTQGNWDVRLPFRYFSADGLCAIDINTRPGFAISDKGSWHDIARAAYGLLHECVEAHSSGGSVKNLGAKSNLILSILSYIPHVHCVPPRAGHQPPNITLCDEISEGMHTSTNEQVFGPARAKGAEVSLPRALNLISPEGSCEVIINTGGGSDTVAWYDLWVAMGAVSAMCVRRGLGGISTGQGRAGKVFVILKSGSQ